MWLSNLIITNLQGFSIRLLFQTAVVKKMLIKDITTKNEVNSKGSYIFED
jgi:hypothetical protein